MKKVLIGLGIFVIACGGIFFWIKSKLDKVQEDTNNSIAISENIKSVFENGFDDWTYEPKEINWNQDFLVMEQGGNGYYNGLYKTEVNKMLGTDKNFPGNTTNKLIVLVYGSIVKGIYEDTNVEAEQMIYELNYLDLDAQKIVKIDTVFGPEPKQSIRKHDRKGFVRFPNDDEVVAKIKESFK